MLVKANENVRKMRLLNDWKQEHVARQINASLKNYQKYETGTRGVPPRYFRRLGILYNKPPEFFYGSAVPDNGAAAAPGLTESNEDFRQIMKSAMMVSITTLLNDTKDPETIAILKMQLRRLGGEGGGGL